ncbi:cell wall hydrolase [Neobacillus mesonae]|uniref:cell wall hydrolase n=1 Tax=Neobacillus mesonae TaxID=1193713 RepID=UPI0020424F55|nr:cell wall hydrolase [Neobacillus mesonae]MCM3571096.1 cell wall hydrolase [Neobacillus mesonae]
MKKLILALTLVISILLTSPVFAYTVKTGDTMSKIARENHLTLEDLAKMNPQIKNLDLIYVGQTVHILEKEAEKARPKPEIIVGYSQSELELLARLVRAEAEDEPYQGKIAVACVVLNRVASSKFPNTIKEVIYQKSQFQPVQNGQINKPANGDSINAVKDALKEKRNIAGNSLFFYNPAIAENRWLDSRATTLVIGRHVFKN